MEYNPKKYIDLIDQILDLDKESKNKTTWIVVKFLNILMTIEVAIFISEQIGYVISIDRISFDMILPAFKNYDIIIGVSCFVIAYFGTRMIAWLLPSAVAYTRFWHVWSINREFKEKLNRNLDDPDEFEKWKVNYDRRYKEAKIYSERFKLTLLFSTNLFLTYQFIIKHHITLLYTPIISLLLFTAACVLGLIYLSVKDNLLFCLWQVNYFENRIKFKVEEIRKIDRYALKLLHWIATVLYTVAILASIGAEFNIS